MLGAEVYGRVAIAGAVAGLLIGLTGVGGGALMTPLLLLVFGVPPLTAIGTDLWFAAITKLVTVRLHHQLGSIEWMVVRRLWSGSLPGASGTLLLLYFWSGETGGAVAGLTRVIGFAVLVSGVAMFAHERIQRLGGRLSVERAAWFRRSQRGLTVAAGSAIGLLVTMTSIGAGALGAVALGYLYPRRLTPPRLVATDNVHAIPLPSSRGQGISGWGMLTVSCWVTCWRGRFRLLCCLRSCPSTFHTELREVRLRRFRRSSA